MKYLRFQKPDTNQWSWGIIENGTMIEEFSNSYFNSLGKMDFLINSLQVKLGSPTLQPKLWPSV